MRAARALRARHAAATTRRARSSRPARARRSTGARRSSPRAASTSASGRIWRTSTSGCGCGSRAGPAAGSRARSRATPAAGSSAALPHGAAAWVERNTLLLVARAFRPRWLPLVAYRQLAWAWHAAAPGACAGTWPVCGWRCRCCPRSCASAAALRAQAVVRVEEVVPARADPGPARGRPPVAPRSAGRSLTVRPRVPVLRRRIAALAARPCSPAPAAAARPERRRRAVRGPVRGRGPGPAAGAEPSEGQRTTRAGARGGAGARPPRPRPAASASAPRRAPQAQLPYTGADAAPSARGAVLLAGGIALRVRLRERS